VQSRRVWVDHDGRFQTATVSGALKAGPRRANTVVSVGDWVTLDSSGDGDLRVIGLLPRRSKISRQAPDDRGAEREHVLAANVDALLIVVAARSPTVNARGLDRLLVLGEISGVPTEIALNKVDLWTAEGSPGEDPLAGRDRLGYRCHRISASTGEGCAELAEALRGRCTLLTGPSGVGKSTLVNRLVPGSDLRASAISAATGKGVHTTTQVDWIPFPGGGALLDSPGLRGVQPWGLDTATLADCFTEMRGLERCAFRDCSHRVEPNCAVRAAVQAGKIDFARYDSYLRIRIELEDLRGRGSR